MFVFHINTLLTLPFLLPRQVILTKSTLVLKQWLACTIFFAITRLHVRTHSSKNYSLIFLHVFILIFLITLPTNTPRMKHQFIQLIHPFLHSTLMIRPTFLRYFIPYLCIFFVQLQIFLQRRRAQDRRKGPPAENDRLPEGGPKALNDPKTSCVGEDPN